MKNRRKDIAILLPYNEDFCVSKAGAAAIWVKEFNRLSKYRNDILVYGNTSENDIISKNYKNIDIDKGGFFFISKTNLFTSRFIEIQKKINHKIIEIHNRPQVFTILSKKISNAKFILIIHNDPQKLRGSSYAWQRKKIIEKVDKIVFISEWVKSRFFKGLSSESYDNYEVIYHGVQKINKKIKKKKLIVFAGKLNKSKGYDLFGQAIIRILDEYTDWKAVVVGDEPRDKILFQHKNLMLKGWISHEETLKIYEKASISVVSSVWMEPFGRTAMESASRGCATIVSKIGGLTETVEHALFIKDITSDKVYKKIKYLINNKKYRNKLQINSRKTVLHTIKANAVKLDNLRHEFLHSNSAFKKFLINRNAKLKILHVSNFGARLFNRIYNLSIAKKLSNGFLRSGHDVIDFSDRDMALMSRKIYDISGKSYINKSVIETFKNYNPDFVLIGHVDSLNINTLEKLKSIKRNTVISQWFEDHLTDGPSYKTNITKVLSNIDFIDHTFVTGHPDKMNFLPKKSNFHYLPIPVDYNIENLEIYNLSHQVFDVFFALSHGVNRGLLKRGKFDEREIFINKLIERNQNIKFDLYGLYNRQPIWSKNFYDIIKNSKMALNLTRGKPSKYLTSNRIASLIGNGLLTFVDIKSQLNDFFTNDEVIFYKNINDLSEKITYYKTHEKLRKKIAYNGRKKYFSLFNSTKVSQYIVSRSFNLNSKDYNF